MLLPDSDGPQRAVAVAQHVALPADRSPGRAWVRLNMISSADGAAVLDGRSGGLGDLGDREVLAGLRAHADAVVVGLSTATAERYGPPGPDDPELYVCGTTPDVSAIRELFDSDRVTLVIPEDADSAPSGMRVTRAGHGRVDPAVLLDTLGAKVVMSEGGPRLAAAFVARGLVDELFVTIAPHVLAGSAPRIAHGDDGADPARWSLVHHLRDGQGFLFLRYARRLAS
jgi:riboflavin biosynthesis pyrimidine reductase